MNANLLALAVSLGISLSERSCYHSHVWDGSSLALYYQTPIFAHPGDIEPIEISKPKMFSDFDICHEIAHWAIADQVERLLPEYGLGWQTQHPYYANGNLNNAIFKITDGALKRIEQEIREARAYFLTLHWCERYGISVPKTSQLNHKDNYYINGDYLFNQVDSIELGWEAIIWLREQRLICGEDKPILAKLKQEQE